MSIAAPRGEGLPQAHGGCSCSCHRVPGVHHVIACCTPGHVLPLSDPEREELHRLRALINTPEIGDFLKAVPLEAAHQQERWGASHDANKTPEDWFWLLGYLGGKVLRALVAGDRDKALHHTISAAAALFNWHRAIKGNPGPMRPGMDPAHAVPDAASGHQ